MSCSNEHCWILTGKVQHLTWSGKIQKESEGRPASVDFDYNYVLKREEEKRDIIGFCHTHPGFLAIPSDRDVRTMGAWVNCLGKPLLCLIEGTDGLRAYLFYDDEYEPLECEEVNQYKDLYFGSNPMAFCFVQEVINEDEVSSRGVVEGQGPVEEACCQKDNCMRCRSVGEQSGGESDSAGMHQCQSDRQGPCGCS